MITIGESEADLARELAGLLAEILPQTEGYAISVEICEKDRKKRKDASRQSWHPGVGEIVIKFDGPSVAQMTRVHFPESEGLSTDKDVADKDVAEKRSGPERRLIEFISALDAAEQRPGFDFIALKWFRDLFLPAEGYEWAESASTRDEVLRSAIRGGVVLTGKVPNPKSPRFPVTAIRLNRLHPAVKATLGDKRVDSGFQPIEIQGEALSNTVLRERR